MLVVTQIQIATAVLSEPRGFSRRDDGGARAKVWLLVARFGWAWRDEEGSAMTYYASVCGDVSVLCVALCFWECEGSSSYVCVVVPIGVGLLRSTMLLYHLRCTVPGRAIPARPTTRHRLTLTSHHSTHQPLANHRRPKQSQPLHPVLPPLLPHLHLRRLHFQAHRLQTRKMTTAAAVAGPSRMQSDRTRSACCVVPLPCPLGQGCPT